MTTWISNFSQEVYTQRSLAKACLQGTAYVNLLTWSLPNYSPYLTLNTALSVGLIEKISPAWVLGAMACGKFMQEAVRLCALKRNGEMVNIQPSGHCIILCGKIMQLASLYFTYRSMYEQPRHFIAVILPSLLYSAVSKIAEWKKKQSVEISNQIMSIYHTFAQTVWTVALLDINA